MCDPHGNPNLLTAPADEKWKAIRKGVAVSFAFQNIRKKFPMVVLRVNRVIARASALGSANSIDVDQLALRVTLDVIGLAGFGHDYESVEKDVPEYDHMLVSFGVLAAVLSRPDCLSRAGRFGQLFSFSYSAVSVPLDLPTLLPSPSAGAPPLSPPLQRVLPRCFTEVMLRIVNPVREMAPSMFKFGTKGELRSQPETAAVESCSSCSPTTTTRAAAAKQQQQLHYHHTKAPPHLPASSPPPHPHRRRRLQGV
jgi:hypothetical protein